MKVRRYFGVCRFCDWVGGVIYSPLSAAYQVLHHQKKHESGPDGICGLIVVAKVPEELLGKTLVSSIPTPRALLNEFLRQSDREKRSDAARRKSVNLVPSRL